MKLGDESMGSGAGLGVTSSDQGYSADPAKGRVTLSAQVVEIAQERARQEHLKASGKFLFTCADPGLAARATIGQQESLIALASRAWRLGDVDARTVVNAIDQRNRLPAAEITEDRAHLPAPVLDDLNRLAILLEEVGEGADEVLEMVRSVGRFGLSLSDVRKKLRAELVQVAAVALGWIEGIDFEEDGPVAELGVC